MRKKSDNSGVSHVWENDFFAKPGALCWLLAFATAASGVFSQLTSFLGQLFLALAFRITPAALSGSACTESPLAGIAGSARSLFAYVFPMLCETALCVLTYAFADPRCGKRFLRYTLTGIFGITASGIWFFYSWHTLSRSGVFLITVGAFLLLLFSNTRLYDRILWFTVTGVLLLLAVVRGIAVSPSSAGEWYTFAAAISDYGKQLLYWILLGLFRHRYNVLHL